MDHNATHTYLVTGGAGFIGSHVVDALVNDGHTVRVVDNFSTGHRENLAQVADRIDLREISITDRDALADAMQGVDYVFHLAALPSVPRSVDDPIASNENNVNGTLNVLWAMHECAPESHLGKLGTMGEYGTPNIDIAEGYFEVEYRGRKDVLPFPKQPGSFYHLTKVHDSNNIMFACKIWGLRATDLNQGVVYGIETEESNLDDRLLTRFDYDESFGTALNRFCVQAVAGIPLTLFGKGHQTRGYLNILDTLQCVELATLNPPAPGRMRVFNQWVERFSVLDLAHHVKKAAEQVGIDVSIAHYRNPRVEAEEHYYNPDHNELYQLGLKPHLLDDSLVESVIRRIVQYQDRIIKHSIVPRIYWQKGATDEYVEIVEEEKVLER